jgi:hypothetical protein
MKFIVDAQLPRRLARDPLEAIRVRRQCRAYEPSTL